MAVDGTTGMGASPTAFGAAAHVSGTSLIHAAACESNAVAADDPCTASHSSSSRGDGIPSASPEHGIGSADHVVHQDGAARIRQLEKEKAELQQRLEFVEELIGPTEAQRKTMQDQLLAARSAAVRAKYRGAGVPIKVAGRLDERLLQASGLSERDAGLLQGGCLPDKDGILQDVSLLGDPKFRPYDEETGEPRWNARGGMLQLSLDEVRARFGDEIAHDVMRCAQELDKYDASRRVGIELPWHPVEDRELEPAEVIELLDRELNLQTSILCGGSQPSSSSAARHGLHEERYPYRCGPEVAPTSANAAIAAAAAALIDMGGVGGGPLASSPEQLSPYAVVNAPPRRGRAGARSRRRDARAGRHRGVSAGVGSGSSNGSAVVPLPRVDASARRMAPEIPSSSCRPGGVARSLGPAVRCGGIPGLLRPRMQDAVDNSILGCAADRNRFF